MSTSVSDLQKKVNASKVAAIIKSKAKKPAPFLKPATLPPPAFPTAAGPPAVPIPSSQTTQADAMAGMPPGYNNTPAGSSTTDFAKLAASIFAPQLNDLGAQEGALKSQAGAADSQLAGLYANLLKSINGDTKFYNQDYQGALGDLANTNQQTHASINNTYDTAAAKEAALLQRLGIQQAAPDVLKQGAIDQNFFNDLTDSNNNAYQNQFNAEHRADLTWNKQQGSISQLQGADARSKIAQNLQTALAQVASQRAGLLSQQRQEAQTLQQQQAQNDLDLTKLQLGSSGSGSSSSAAAQLKGPGAQLATEAATLYPNQNAASNAVKAVQDAIQYAQPNQIDNVEDFVNFLHSRNRGANDWANLQELAQYMYKLMGSSSF